MQRALAHLLSAAVPPEERLGNEFVEHEVHDAPSDGQCQNPGRQRRRAEDLREPGDYWQQEGKRGGDGAGHVHPRVAIED